MAEYGRRPFVPLDTIFLARCDVVRVRVGRTRNNDIGIGTKDAGRDQLSPYGFPVRKTNISDTQKAKRSVAMFRTSFFCQP